MMEREELLRSKEYWMANIQNDLYGMVEEYRKKHGLKQKDLAAMLDVSKGYISQILHGDFNHKLSKLVELSLAFNKAPRLIYQELEELIRKDAQGENVCYANSLFANDIIISTAVTHNEKQQLQPVYAEDTDSNSEGALIVDFGKSPYNQMQSNVG